MSKNIQQYHDHSGCARVPIDVYKTDMADEIDSEEEIIAEKFEVSIITAKKIMLWRDTQVTSHSQESNEKFIGFLAMLLDSPNNDVVIRGLAAATGLDVLNGVRSQSEAGKQIGKHRATISHSATGWQDIISDPAFNDHFQCNKFMKKPHTRETYRKRATNPFTAIKKAAVERLTK